MHRHITVFAEFDCRYSVTLYAFSFVNGTKKRSDTVSITYLFLCDAELKVSLLCNFSCLSHTHTRLEFAYECLQ